MILLSSALGAVLLAVIRRVRRRRRAAPGRQRPWVRRGGLVAVLAIVLGTGLVGAPAYAQSGFDPLNCTIEPEPERPGAGVVGLIDPPTAGVGLPDSVYNDYSYAGLVWHTYGTGCGGLVAPGAEVDTWLGNQLFSAAKILVGTANWAHYEVEDGISGLQVVDGFVRDGVNVMWESVFVRWVAVALLGLSVILLVQSMRGDLAGVTRYVAATVLALSAAGAAFLAPATWTTGIDEFVYDATREIQRGFLPDANRDTFPTLLHDHVVWENWQRGEFGSLSPTADQFGRELLNTQAFSKWEVLEAPEGLEGGQAILDQRDAKMARFAEISEELGGAKPYFQGIAGSRVGIGFLALFESLALTLFPLLAKATLLLALLIIRLLLILMPGIAVIGIVRPQVLPNVLRVGGAAVVNALIMAGLAGLHFFVVNGLLGPSSPIAIFPALILIILITLVFWAIGRPVRRLVTMARMAGSQIGLEHDPNVRLRRTIRRQGRRARGGWRRGGGGDNERWWERRAREAGEDRPEAIAAPPASHIDITQVRTRAARPHGTGEPAALGTGTPAVTGRRAWAVGQPKALPAGTGAGDERPGAGSPSAGPGRGGGPGPNPEDPPVPGRPGRHGRPEIGGAPDPSGAGQSRHRSERASADGPYWDPDRDAFVAGHDLTAAGTVLEYGPGDDVTVLYDPLTEQTGPVDPPDVPGPQRDGGRS